MATVVETKPTLGEERFLLTDVSWGFYLKLCDEFDGRNLRASYDRGNLELMITKSPHEFYKTLLGKLIEQIVFELDIPVRSGGSMTFQREDLERGFEPDESWWIEHEREVRGQAEFDFQKDPPPDLAVEVEITSSLVDRIGLYASLGIRELWRFDGQTLRFCRLQESGQYDDSQQSHAFPFLAPVDLMPFLKLDNEVDETTQMKRFVAWIREQGFSR